MSRDSERGIGYLVGHEDPQKKAQRLRDLNRQIRGSVTPLSDPMDVFTSLPLATEVNLGTSNSLATPEITSPVKSKRKGPTKGQIYRGAMAYLTRPKLSEQEKEFWGAWNNSDKMLKYVKKHTDAYAGEDEPATDAPKKERFNDRIQEQDRVSVSNNKVKGLSNRSRLDLSPRNEIADRKPKILSTPIGNVKIINSTNQKDIANKQPRKKYESL